MILIFHPSCITYDNSISKTWEQYRLKRKKNQNVKDFRQAIGMSEKGNYLVGGGTVEFNGRNTNIYSKIGNQIFVEFR